MTHLNFAFCKLLPIWETPSSNAIVLQVAACREIIHYGTHAALRVFVYLRSTKTSIRKGIFFVKYILKYDEDLNILEQRQVYSYTHTSVARAAAHDKAFPAYVPPMDPGGYNTKAVTAT
jgi:hypothetical protein